MPQPIVMPFRNPLQGLLNNLVLQKISQNFQDKQLEKQLEAEKLRIEARKAEADARAKAQKQERGEARVYEAQREGRPVLQAPPAGGPPPGYFQEPDTGAYVGPKPQRWIDYGTFVDPESGRKFNVQIDQQTGKRSFWVYPTKRQDQDPSWQRKVRDFEAKDGTKMRQEYDFNPKTRREVPVGKPYKVPKSMGWLEQILTGGGIPSGAAGPQQPSDPNIGKTATNAKGETVMWNGEEWVKVE